jgi:hypothetical protein
MRWMLAILLAAAGCGDDGGEADAHVEPGDAWVEIGAGDTEFEELAAESDMILVAGPQGGHHFVLHARMGGMVPGDPTQPGLIGNPSTRFTVWSEDGERVDVDPPPYRLGYEEATDGAYVLASGHIIQVIEEEVAALHGARVRVRVEVSDVNGESASDERWVVAIEDPIPDPGFDAAPR